MIPVGPRSGAFRFRRRDFLRAAPAGLAAGVWPAAGEAAQPRPVDTEDPVDCASSLAGLEFSAAERDQLRPDTARNRRRFNELRQLAIGPDVPPAFAFHPYRSNYQPAGPATPHADLGMERPDLAAAPADPGRLALLPVTALSRLVERRQVTSLELTRVYLDRLKRYGSRLNCVVTLTEDRALEQAAEADREIAAGRYRGPLHGIPWGAKDLFAARGARTTWGARPYAQQIIDQDATVVERLNDAGAVLVAKLSMGALARGSVWFGGMTRNPWAPARGSSGSSAGPGAATAAGLVAFSVGTETLGSIISPSAACGVTGLRPTYGRVSRSGAMTLSWTMDKIGPMCRTAEDCALVFNAIYGPDGRDQTVMDAPFAWAPRVDLAALRVGFVSDEFQRPPFGQLFGRPEAAARELAVQRTALDGLRQAGLVLEPIQLPAFPAEALRVILNAEAAAAFDDLTRSGGIDQLTEQGPDAWPNVFRASRFIPAVEYIRAQRARTLLAREFDALMSRFDLVVSPALSASLTMTNMTGHPALAFKAGFSAGLPVPLMLTGRLYEEATVLQAARAFQQVTAWHTMHPPLDGAAPQTPGRR